MTLKDRILRRDPAPAAEAASDEGTPRRRPLARRLLGSSPFTMLVVLVGLLAVFDVAAPGVFLTPANATNIVTDAATLLVMATGVTFVMIAAGFDLSIGSVLVFAGVCGASTMQALGTDGPGVLVAGLVVSIAAGVLWGLFNGLVITRLRVPALITTLGTLGAALGLANVLTGGNDLRDVPLSLVLIGSGSFLGIGWLVWIAAAVVLVGGLVLHLTRYGRHTYVIGSNPEAARRSGIAVDRHLVSLYALTGGLAGLAGMMSLARFATTTIGGHSQDSLVVITGVVLGGTSLFGGAGAMIGTVIGIFIPAALSNGFVVLGIQPFWQQVATGLVLIAAVYLDQRKRRSRDRS